MKLRNTWPQRQIKGFLLRSPASRRSMRLISSVPQGSGRVVASCTSASSALFRAATAACARSWVGWGWEV